MHFLDIYAHHAMCITRERKREREEMKIGRCIIIT